MSLSMYTAMVIQTSEVCAGSSRDFEGKYSGEIWVMREGELHSLLLSTKAAFDDGVTAAAHMEDLIERIRDIDLTA